MSIEKFKDAIGKGMSESTADPWEPFIRLVREANDAIDQCAPSPEASRARLRLDKAPPRAANPFAGYRSYNEAVRRVSEAPSARAHIVIAFPGGTEERFIALVYTTDSVDEIGAAVAWALSSPDIASRLYVKVPV